MKYLIIFTFAAVFFACENSSGRSEGVSNSVSATSNGSAAVADTGAAVPEATPSTGQAKGEPRTIRDFFTLLPEKYFILEGCDKSADKNCNKARADYLKNFTEVEDVKNGYFKGGCDGGQACIEMAIFKKPDGTYLTGVHTSAELNNDFYFLEYAGGKWTDVSAKVIPEFSKKNWYEIPRVGTTMKVFAKNITEKGDDYEVSEQGSLLYSLTWKDGKFTRQ